LRSWKWVYVGVVFIITLGALPLPAVSSVQAPLVLGIYPYLSSTELHKRFAPLAEYLGKELGRPVEIRLNSSYESHVETIGTGKVDIAFIGPAAYVKLVDQYGQIPLLAAFETARGRTYTGVIFVKKGSPLKTLAQLKGKSFAFGPVDSTMTNLVPRYMLLAAGIDLLNLGNTESLANHENIVLGVLAGRYDAGAVKDEIFNQYEPQGLQSLAVSDPVADHLFVARAGLPSETVRKIGNLLISMKNSEEGRRSLAAIQKNLRALVPVNNSDYDSLRKILDVLAKAGVKP
jgi:phosphonate transport system substrate-binding protein